MGVLQVKLLSLILEENGKYSNGKGNQYLLNGMSNVIICTKYLFMPTSPDSLSLPLRHNLMEYDGNLFTCKQFQAEIYMST